MPATSVYNFQDPIDFLSSYINSQKSEDPSFSIKTLSQSLGLNSPVAIIDILRRKKKIKDKLAHKLITTLKIDASEKMYLEALIAKSQTDSLEKKRLYDLIINELSPTQTSKFKPLYTSELNIFSHWVYMAIIALAEIPSFELTAKNIQQKLIEDLPLKEIEHALFELFSHGILTVDSNKKIEVKFHRTTTKSDTHHDQAAAYYSLVCELAQKSIQTPLEEREFSCFALSLAKEDIPVAKEIIRKCRSNLGKLSQKKEADCVYQANLMFFPLTK